VCSKVCLNQNSIFCPLCNNWFHDNCVNLSKQKYSVPFFCIQCIAEALPIGAVSMDATVSSKKLSDFDLSSYLSTDNTSHYLKNLKKTDLTVLHLNVRSLTKNIEKVEELINTLQHMPDIIAISETKLNLKSNIALIQLPGYTFEHVDSTSNAGGVGVFVKSSISYHVNSELHFSMVDCENLWLEIEIPKFDKSKRNNKSIIGIIYKHPHCNLDNFMNKFGETSAKINKTKQFYIAGDINIELLKFDCSKPVGSNLDLLVVSIACVKQINQLMLLKHLHLY